VGARPFRWRVAERQCPKTEMIVPQELLEPEILDRGFGEQGGKVLLGDRGRLSDIHQPLPNVRARIIPRDYSIPSGLRRLGGGNSPSRVARSASVRARSGALRFSRRCAPCRALGMTIIPSWRRSQASATWAGVALRRAATSARPLWPSMRPCSIGE